MGRPKAWLPYGGRTMLLAVLDAVRDGLVRAESAAGGGDGGERGSAPREAPPLVVVGAPGQVLPPLPEGTVRVDDEVEGEGPLRGMAAGLLALEGRADAAYVASCDTPLLRPEFVARMIGLLGDADVVVPLVEDRHHPLAVVYRAGVLPEIRSLLRSGRRRPFFLFEMVRTRVAGPGDLRSVDPDLDSLRNFNTPDEYEELRARSAGTPAAGGRP